ncbi:LOW QUALITY PROTEIN: prolyl 3-hydroxylase OGFOD1-like [Gigantopelta aegis]|uniref:LOW QUALITY PROTEIN: prolyl 3-hydroxylase OGFOD1-like n=1 Tax=Gigantopelta aegis TaxID=1735272 RepID=UPI001B88C869|nr:LOW QUALITY PROTEIN: prolyl 3-hydroxylase OGFOD1-like [Gigantopelta aegis]
MRMCCHGYEKLTGIDLSECIDMTCSKYEYADTLLCHDDELEGRRVAFIYYLTDPTWSHEDGGRHIDLMTLDLYNTDDHGQPSDIAQSIIPQWNSFAFFEVNPVSFHQVSEILSADKVRLSINGWFHGPPVPRPSPYKETLPTAFTASGFTRWRQEYGGFTSYITKGEDEELLTVTPQSNSLTLVYKDSDTLSFTKYINHRAEVPSDSTWYTNNDSL